MVPNVLNVLKQLEHTGKAQRPKSGEKGASTLAA
jgi:hypothetical protein